MVVEHQEGALSGYRVLDLADSKGAYCTKLLADMEAEVIKIEPLKGPRTGRSSLSWMTIPVSKKVFIPFTAMRASMELPLILIPWKIEMF